MHAENTAFGLLQLGSLGSHSPGVLRNCKWVTFMQRCGIRHKDAVVFDKAPQSRTKSPPTNQLKKNIQTSSSLMIYFKDVLSYSSVPPQFKSSINTRTHRPASSILIRAKSMGQREGTWYLDTADNKSSGVGFIRQAPCYL